MATNVTNNGQSTIKELKEQFNNITALEPTKDNAIAAIEHLNLNIDLSDLNFNKSSTWLEVNQLLINATQDDTNLDDDLDDDDLDDDEILETTNNTGDRVNLDNWIDRLEKIHITHFNSKCDLKVDDHAHISLDGTYKIAAKKQFEFGGKKLTAKFNYGTGKVLLSSNYQDYYVLGSIDRNEFTPCLDLMSHDLIMRHLSPTESMLGYRTAIAVIESKLIRANTLQVAKKRQTDKELKKTRRSNLASIIDLANSK